MIPAMRPIVIAGNWKMHTTPAEAAVLATDLAAVMADASVVRVLCPPAIALPMVAQALAGTGIEVGAQNVHAEVAGAYTGELSAAMVAPYATWTIVGHSERRRDQGERDALIGEQRHILQDPIARRRAELGVGGESENSEWAGHFIAATARGRWFGRARSEPRSTGRDSRDSPPTTPADTGRS